MNYYDWNTPDDIYLDFPVNFKYKNKRIKKGDNMKVITKKEWQETPKGYKAVINNQKYILANEGEKGTALIPIILKNTDK